MLNAAGYGLAVSPDVRAIAAWCLVFFLRPLWWPSSAV
jgi:hypothetical protein